AVAVARAVGGGEHIATRARARARASSIAARPQGVERARAAVGLAGAVGPAARPALVRARRVAADAVHAVSVHALVVVRARTTVRGLRLASAVGHPVAVEAGDAGAVAVGRRPARGEAR